jgi:hypothetical protein
MYIYVYMYIYIYIYVYRTGGGRVYGPFPLAHLTATILRNIEDDIEMNEDGMICDDIDRVFQIRAFYKTEVYQNEVYRING